MSVAADHNLVDNVLQPLTNGDDVADVDVRHELLETSTSSKENSEVKSILPGADEIPTDDIVAKATDAAAEVLLLHLEANGDLETISPAELSEESHEEAQLTLTGNGASEEHVILPALDAKAESTQDTLIEPSVEAILIDAKESPEDPAATVTEPTSIESKDSVSPSVKDNLSDVTEGDELGHAVAISPGLEDAAEANKGAGDVPSTPKVIDIPLEQTHTAVEIVDGADVSGSASLSDDLPTAENPTLVTEAALAQSSNDLEENVTVPEPEPSNASSQEEATPVSDAVPGSMSESQDISSQVTAENGSLAEEVVVLDVQHVEAPTPITTDASPSQPTTSVEAVSAPAEGISLPEAQEPVAAPSEEAPVAKVEEEAIEQEIVEALAEADEVEQVSPGAAVEESSVAATEEIPIIEAQDAPVQTDATVVEEAKDEGALVEEKAIDEDVTVAEEESAVVEEVPEAAAAEIGTVAATDDTPTPDTAPIIEDASVIEEAAAMEAVEEVPSTDADAPIVEEATTVEAEAPATSAEVPIVKAVEEEAPVTNPAGVEETSAIEEGHLALNAEVPTVEPEAPATNLESSITDSASPIEEVPAIQAEVSDAKEVPDVDETSATEAEVPDIDPEAEVTESHQVVLDVAAPTLEQDVDSDEAAKAPVAEAPSVAGSESVTDEKPIADSLLPDVEQKAVEDLPAEVEEALSQVEEGAAEVIEEPTTEETEGTLIVAAVDEPITAEEEVTHQEPVQEDLAEVAEEQSDAVILEAEVDVIDDTAEEHIEEKNVKVEEVVPVAHAELEIAINNVANEQNTIASESTEIQVVEPKEVLQDETSVPAEEPLLHVDEPEPSAELPTPVDESIIAPNGPQDDVKPDEGHQAAVEEPHLDVQAGTVEELTPASTRDAVEPPEEDVTPATTDGNAAPQQPLVEDTLPATSAASVETPNPIDVEEAPSVPSEVNEDLATEAATVDTDLPIADLPTDKLEHLEDLPPKVQQEELQVETETLDASLGGEAREADPSVDELPAEVAHPSTVLVDETPAVEAAIEEAEISENRPESDDTPAIPLPIDETVEEVPEAVQPVSEEPTVEVHATVEPPVSIPIEDVATPEGLAEEVHEEVDDETLDRAPIPDTAIVTESTPEDHLDTQLSLEGASAVETQIFDTTSPALPEEMSTAVDAVESTEANLFVLSNDEQKPIVDDTPTIPLEATSIQEPPATTPETSLTVDELSIPKEMEPAAEEQHILFNAGADVEERHEDQDDVVQEAEGKTDDIDETIVPEAPSSTTDGQTLTHEVEHTEISVEAEPTETTQEHLDVGEIYVAEDSVPLPEQPSIETDTLPLTEEADTPEEMKLMTYASLEPASNSMATDVLEPSTNVEDHATDLEFNTVEDEAQLHTETTEQATSPSEDLLTPASGAEIERPKSPWTPSFQVTTVGRGVSSSDENEDVPTPEPEQFDSASIVEAPADESVMAETLLEVPQVVTPVEEQKNEAPESLVLPPDVELSQLHVDTPSLDTPPAEIARPWTPSYSVHSQGSPLHGATDLEQEVPSSEQIKDSHEPVEDGPELPDMEFATNEEAPKVAIPAVPTEQIEEATQVIEPDSVTTEAAEEPPLPDVPTPVVDEALVDEAPTAAVVAPSVIEGMDVHFKSLHVDTEPSPTEQDTQGLGSALDFAEKDVATALAEDVPLNKSTSSEEVTPVPQLVLDTSEEVTELRNLPERESSPSHLTPEQYEQTHERPASPSWVASYSVNTQGSPLQGHAPLVEERAFTIEEVTPPKEEPSPTPAVVEVHTEIAMRNDASREPSEATTAIDDSVKESEDEMSVEEAAHIKPQSFLVLVNDAEPDVQEDTPPATSFTLVDDATNLEDRPKSPWTPSYSVTMQGPGTPGEEKELNDIEPLPQRALDIDTSKDSDHDDLKTAIDTTTPNATENTPPPKASVVAAAEESKLPPVMALERELQELQATIHLDGDVTPIANVAVVDATQQEYFPSVETSEQKEKLSKLSVSRLAPVDEIEGMDTGLTASETLSSPSTRSRLESTTSSRFFPGGWFSTASKVVDEGRTSLEIAQGEFTPSKVISPIFPAGDVSDTPDDASATSTATGHATDSDDEDEEPEPKRRWCVVM